jgi:lipopolysaccharide cholinephosphotransferase
MRDIIDIDELKLIQLNLLNEFDCYCKKYGLRYYLAYGSLIGAIRHNGYIPWDDDIDLMMPRYDYDKLVLEFNNHCEKKEIRLLHQSIDEDYYLPMAKLVNTNTVIKENIDSDIDFEIGVYIDIFPLDNLSDDLNEARKRIKRGLRYNMLWILKTVKLNPKRALTKNLVLLISKIPLKFMSVSEILVKLEQFCKIKKDVNFTNYVGVMTGLTESNDTKIFKKEWFKEEVKVKFESAEYPAPAGMHLLLSNIYGDYMKLPPKEQQISHHSFSAWYKEFNDF